MKSKFLIILLLCLSFNSFVFAQDRSMSEKDIPFQIKNYLRQNYSEAIKIEYYRILKSDTIIYEVEFKVKKTDYNLKFAQHGALLETEREIELDELDPTIRLKIKVLMDTTFAKNKIEKVQEVDPTGLKRYEVTVKVKSKKNADGFTNGRYTVLFDESGKLLKIEKEELISIESVF